MDCRDVGGGVSWMMRGRWRCQVGKGMKMRKRIVGSGEARWEKWWSGRYTWGVARVPVDCEVVGRSEPKCQRYQSSRQWRWSWECGALSLSSLRHGEADAGQRQGLSVDHDEEALAFGDLSRRCRGRRKLQCGQATVLLVNRRHLFN